VKKYKNIGAKMIYSNIDEQVIYSLRSKLHLWAFESIYPTIKQSFFIYKHKLLGMI